jgi:ferric-dicitrate binding protein FerR (iron transport regulator)
MRLGIIVALAASLVAFQASAGSTLIYDGRGKLDRVIRQSPSGFIVYDGRGDILSAVRQTGFDRPLIVDAETTGIRVLGTRLSNSVSTLRGGVGFE